MQKEACRLKYPRRAYLPLNPDAAAAAAGLPYEINSCGMRRGVLGALPHGVDRVAGVMAAAARGAPTARGLGLAGDGINGGLRGMSDLETRKPT